MVLTNKKPRSSFERFELLTVRPGGGGELSLSCQMSGCLPVGPEPRTGRNGASVRVGEEGTTGPGVTFLRESGLPQPWREFLGEEFSQHPNQVSCSFPLPAARGFLADAPPHARCLGTEKSELGPAGSDATEPRVVF